MLVSKDIHTISLAMNRVMLHLPSEEALGLGEALGLEDTLELGEVLGLEEALGLDDALELGDALGLDE